MLIGLDPILSPDLLHTLRAMGHGDTIAIVDANYPATSNARRLHRLDGVDASHALRAILSVMPLDTFIDRPAISMRVVGDPEAIPEAVAEFQEIVNTVADNPAQIASVERFDFYSEAKDAYAILQTGESRLYANIILAKGVIPPK